MWRCLVGRPSVSVGDVFDRLTVISILSRRTKQGGLITNCQCSCGNTKLIHARHLKDGATKSCGCLKQELGKLKNVLPLGVAAANEWYAKLKRSALVRKYQFCLSIEEAQYLGQQDCHYCGAEPREIFNQGECNGSILRNGLDRVDNTVGYIINNLVPCCSTCNRAKHILTLSEFQSWISRIVAKNS